MLLTPEHSNACLESCFIEIFVKPDDFAGNQNVNTCRAIMSVDQLVKRSGGDILGRGFGGGSKFFSPVPKLG